MLTKNLSKIIYGLSLFSFSLGAFNLKAVGLAYLLLGYYILSNGGFKPLDSRLIYAGLAILLFYTITVSISVFHHAYFRYLIKPFFLLFYAYLILVTLFQSKSDELVSYSLKFLILIHSLFFLIQLIGYQITGSVFDFNNYVRSVESDSLYFSKALEGAYLGIRAGGLFSEPSFYAMTVVPASILLAMKYKTIIGVSLIGLLTAILSMSVAAWSVIGIFLFLFFCTGNDSWKVRILVLALLVIATPFAYDFFEKRVLLASDYDAIASRSAIFDEIAIRSGWNNIFGSGFYWDDRFPQGITKLWGYQIRDSSFYVYLFYGGGLVFTTIFMITIFLIARKKWSYLIYILPVFLFKFHILYGLIHVYVIYWYGLLVKNNNDLDTRKIK